MIRGGKLRIIRQILYRLKRGWGLPLAIQYQTSTVADITTGVITQSIERVDVKRAVVLPSTIHKEFKYDIGYLKANSNFTYGGLLTTGTRQVLIDRSDLPKGYIIEPSDNYTIIFDGKRYNIKTVEDMDLQIGYYITMEYVGNTPKNELHVEHVTSKLIMGETVGGTTS